jgi:hypothetical protein
MSGTAFLTLYSMTAIGLATELTAVGRKTIADFLCSSPFCGVYVREWYHSQRQRYCAVCADNLAHATHQGDVAA